MKSTINPNQFLILIVDDVPINLKVLRGILDPMGYELTFATSGKQTLERVSFVKPDLILLDLMMPDMDGLEVCKALYANPDYQDIPIIFLTASQEEKHLINAFEEGAVDYITKPFNKPELLARIKTHLDLKHYRDRLEKQLKQEKLMNQITQNILSQSNLTTILDHSVHGIGNLLEADRVIIGCLNAEKKAEIIAEYIRSNCPSIRGECITDLKIKIPNHLDRRSQIQIIDTTDNEVDFPTRTLNLISRHPIKSEVIIPLLQKERPWGVVIVDYCESSHVWKEDELGLLTQLITQTEIAIQQSELYRKLEIANEGLYHLAHFDGLTNIYNRRHFDISIKKEWLRLRREKQPLSLILGDVDRFKKYNDFYGHLMGDECLQEVAKTMSKIVKRSADILARYGGEEFAILLPNTDLKGATHIAKLIQESVVKLQIPHLNSEQQYVTMSLGVASVIPSLDSSFKALVDLADKALFEAKTQGRNRFVIAEPMINVNPKFSKEGLILTD